MQLAKAGVILSIVKNKHNTAAINPKALIVFILFSIADSVFNKGINKRGPRKSNPPLTPD
jgi:hypothetical protein